MTESEFLVESTSNTTISITTRTAYSKKILISIISVLSFTCFLLNTAIVGRIYKNDDSESVSKSVSKTSTSGLSKQNQQIIILAGPHKTGSSSLQANMYLWTMQSQTQTNKTSSSRLSHSSSSFTLPNWKWPAPEPIVQAKSNKYPEWWEPSKAFYPFMEAMIKQITPNNLRNQDLEVFEKYSTKQVLEFYQLELQNAWNLGWNIVFGTEAFDFLVSFIQNHTNALNFFQYLENHILNLDGIDPSQVTIVVAYRTPKIKHMISMWLQKCPKDKDKSFHEWLLHFCDSASSSLRSLDVLGLVSNFLQYTQYAIALVDLSGVSEIAESDISSIVACQIMDNVLCDEENRHIIGLKEEPLVKNVKQGSREIDVEEDVLNEIDLLLRRYDCNYRYLFSRGEGQKGVDPRLNVLYPFGLSKLMEECDSITFGDKGVVDHASNFLSIKELKKLIVAKLQTVL